MLEKRRAAAQAVADNLIAAELAIDRALHSTALLSGSIPAARIDIGVAAEIGQEALEQASSTFAALVQARRGIIHTHRHLAKDQIDIGLREIALGGLMPKPPIAGHSPHLSIVSEKAA
jgi:hypothetical protein